MSKFLIFLTLAVSFAVFIIAAGNLDTSVSDEDRVYIDSIMGYGPNSQGIPPNINEFEDELELILAVQHQVLKVTPLTEGIPNGEMREPKDLFLLKNGLCYDRSRSIEKILKSHGFETRHVAIFSKDQNKKSGLGALLSTDTESHAVSEVLTSRGWLLVDSNDPWVAVDEYLQPHDAAYINEVYSSPGPHWYGDFDDQVSTIYKGGFVHVYGLYSRHGQFYPPYNFVPDFSLKELKENL